MRTRLRVSGLLAALTLLLTAVPIVCCFGGPGPGAHSRVHAQAYRPPALTASFVQDESARGCTEHTAPAQTPYIETSGGSGGAPATTRSAADAAADPTVPVLADALRPARPHGVAADATGPPLWLTTCVSRT